MKRFLTITTLITLLTLLILGINAPSNPLMLLAATTQDYIYVRLGLILIVASLLMYQPPRSKLFRSMLAMVGTILMATGLWTAYNYEIKLLDLLMLLEVSIVLYIEAAELTVAKAPARTPSIEFTSRKSAKSELRTA